ncbi:4066_t:CDS:2, partial [Funneliformis mosseae]
MEFIDYNEQFPDIETQIKLEVGSTFLRLKLLNNISVNKGKIWAKTSPPSYRQIKKIRVQRRLDVHNHEISLETITFATAYRSFTSQIIKDIEFYVIHGRSDASIVQNLLQPKYPGRVFWVMQFKKSSGIIRFNLEMPQHY